MSIYRWMNRQVHSPAWAEFPFWSCLLVLPSLSSHTAILYSKTYWSQSVRPGISNRCWGRLGFELLGAPWTMITQNPKARKYPWVIACIKDPKVKGTKVVPKVCMFCLIKLVRGNSWSQERRKSAKEWVTTGVTIRFSETQNPILWGRHLSS